MTEQQESGDEMLLLDWDVADRMRKALRASGMGVGEIAAYLGVARNTVSTWINGHIQPSPQTLRLWAMRTGVTYEWLKDGKSAPSGPEPGNRLEPSKRVTHQYLAVIHSDFTKSPKVTQQSASVSRKPLSLAA